MKLSHILKFNHNHDDRGRFSTTEGSGEGSGSEDKGEGSRAHPIACGKDIEKAAKLIAEGKHVTLNQPDEVATLVHKIATEAKAAKAKGQAPPVWNVADISVPGTNLFAQENLGIPRVDMPQLGGRVEPGSKAAQLLPKGSDLNTAEVDLTDKFLQSIKDKGITETDETVPASHLRCTQSELDGEEVAAITGYVESGTIHPGTITVTKDNYILDGHHRWAANIVAGLDEHKDLTMPVHKLNVDIGTALTMAKDFQKQWGIAAAHLGPKTAKKFNQNHDEKGRFATANAQVNPGDEDKFKELKSQQAKLNTSLLPYVDNPTAPEVQEKMDEMKGLVKQMAQLKADPGGVKGIGLPGGPKDIVVVGGGPGGMTSAIMGATDGLDTTVIEAQPTIGGQAKFSSRIENFPGFPIGVSGAALAHNMYDQATRLGVNVKTGTRVVGLSNNPDTGIKTLTLDSGEKIEARAVVLAGGVEFRKVQFPGCDSKDVVYGNGQMLRDNYKDKTVVILGGSNGAAQAALGVAQTAKEVYLVSRSPLEKAMSDYQIQAVEHHAKIHVLQNEQIKEAVLDPNGDVNGVTTTSGRHIPASAVGVFLGSAPNTNWLPPEVARQEGKLKVDSNLETGIPGVFAVGDTRVGSIGRVGAAVGDGQMAEKGVFGYFAQFEKPPSVVAAAKAEGEGLDALIDALFELDKEYPQPLSEFVEEDEDTPAKKVATDCRLSRILKFNPHHDEKGRFSTADGKFPTNTKDQNQQWEELHQKFRKLWGDKKGPMPEREFSVLNEDQLNDSEKKQWMGLLKERNDFRENLMRLEQEKGLRTSNLEDHVPTSASTDWHTGGQASDPQMSLGFPDERVPENATPKEKELLTQKIVSVEKLGGGVSDTRKVEFQNGTYGVFKSDAGEPEALRKTIESGYQSAREVGAWNVAKTVGLDDLAPAVVKRRVGGKTGSLMEWRDGNLAGNTNLNKRYDGSEDAGRAALYDFVIGNTDRHTHNWLLSPGDRLELIDHSLAFPDREDGVAAPHGHGNYALLQHASYYGNPLDQPYFKEDQKILPPKVYADPYLEKKDAILKGLKEAGLSDKAVAGVKSRIDFLNEDRSWDALEKFYTGDWKGQESHPSTVSTAEVVPNTPPAHLETDPWAHGKDPWGETVDTENGLFRPKKPGTPVVPHTWDPEQKKFVPAKSPEGKIPTTLARILNNGGGEGPKVGDKGTPELHTLMAEREAVEHQLRHINDPTGKGLRTLLNQHEDVNRRIVALGGKARTVVWDTPKKPKGPSTKMALTILQGQRDEIDHKFRLLAQDSALHGGEDKDAEWRKLVIRRDSINRKIQRLGGKMVPLSLHTTKEKNPEPTAAI